MTIRTRNPWRKRDDDDDEEDGILRDGDRHRIPVMMKDGTCSYFPSVPRSPNTMTTHDRDRAEFLSHCLNAPIDTVDSINDHHPTNDERQRAYDEYNERISNAWWRSKAGEPEPSTLANSPMHQTQDEIDRVKDAAYAEYEQRLVNGWRNQ